MQHGEERTQGGGERHVRDGGCADDHAVGQEGAFKGARGNEETWVGEASRSSRGGEAFSVSGARQLGLRRVRVRMRVRGGVRMGGVRAPRGVEPRDSASVGDK